ncbi:hypothetical protein TrVFT333_009981 [Trichoderma virens FT-333]|nr:hypothetical protein TrVFT333_009981 [Trichoderma virens FT-333]
MESGPAEQDFDDEISLASTDDGDGDELFVAQILAERHVNGEPHCLIRWQDLPIAEATWEPRENLPDELMGTWEQTKADQENGLAPKFRVQEWKDAATKSYELKLARHHRRNAVRARRGHPQTTLSTLYEFMQQISMYPNEEEEEEEEEEADRVGPSHAEMWLEQNLDIGRRLSFPQEIIREGLFGTPDETSPVNPPEKVAVDHPAKLKSALKSAETTTRASVSFILPPSDTSHEVLKRPSLSHRAIAARSRPTGHTTNVFAGGRTRKGRGTLSEVAANPEVNPKFLNSRLKRKIELQRRDREGIKEPARRPSGLISLDYNNPQDTPSEQQSADNSKDDQDHGKRRSPTKGVAHWEDEPMEIDPSDSLFVSDQTPSPAPHDSDDEMTQPDTEEQPASQTVCKTVQLGPDRQSVVTLSFYGIPQETGLAWAEQFRSNERLVFTHTCNSQDFLCQTGANGSLSIVRLCEGTVLSYTENESLKSVASNLKLGSLGLLCPGENFCVYMFFPDKLEGQLIQDCDTITLEYHIFKQVGSLAPLMLGPAPQLIVSDKSDKTSPFWSRPLDQIFGHKYEQLLPIHASNAEKHNFFLAFPTRAEQEALL